MKGNSKKIFLIFLTIVSIIMIIVMYYNMIFFNKKYQEETNKTISNIISKIIEQYPDVQDEEIIKILNNETSNENEGNSLLSKYGINTGEIEAVYSLEEVKENAIKSNICILIVFIILFLIMIYCYNQSQKKKIEKIISYIKEINRKNYDLKIDDNTEDELSKLRNELYKITITLREEADHSKKDKKLLETSLSDISHQLKTPLTSISIMLDNIIQNPSMAEETKRQFIFEINRQIEWINWLVISLLKLSKLDSGTVEFEREKISVKELIENVKQNLSIPLDIKQQDIICIGKDIVSFIGDYHWQLEAITNIIKNCIEHTPENRNIWVSYEESKFYTKIIIKDEGEGIDKEDLKHIFERFYKGKNSSSDSVGIGLALAKAIIEKQDGTIKCHSRKGEGTTFEIRYIKE